LDDDSVKWEHNDYVLNGDDEPSGGHRRKMPVPAGSPGCGCMLFGSVILIFLLALLHYVIDKIW
jgi:hypothetical protein